MAYSSTNPLVPLGDATLTQLSSATAASAYLYASTHNSTDILATGFFTGVGAGSRGGQDLRVKVGDIIINRASTNAAIPGRVSLHSVLSATADVASTLASSGWGASYNVTVSGNT